jgi:hypothetical protein
MPTNNPMMKNLIRDNSTSGLHFVLCESCFWSATLLKITEDFVCPVCADVNVSFIPLSINESSRLSMSAKSWLESSFSSAKKNSACSHGQVSTTLGFNKNNEDNNNNHHSTMHINIT